jgi:hypothetical protein
VRNYHPEQLLGLTPTKTQSKWETIKDTVKAKANPALAEAIQVRAAGPRRAGMARDFSYGAPFFSGGDTHASMPAFSFRACN